MSQDNAYYVRKFLNTEKEGGIAFVEARISRIDGDDKGFSAGLTIGDCSRNVTLDFDIWGKESAHNIRQKITTLRRIITAFEAILLTQAKEIEESV